MTRDRPGSMRLLALALLSAAGLLVAGLVTTVRGARAAEERALGEADRAALFAAQAVARRMQERPFLEVQPEELRFAIVDGALVVPAALDWLESPPIETPELDLPWPALQALREAETASRVHDASRAQAASERAAHESEGAATRARDWLRLALAWSAEHRGDETARDAWLDAIEGGAPLRNVIAGVLLLSNCAHRVPPAWAVDAFPKLTAERARAVVARLHEEAAPGELVARLAVDAARAGRWRATLQLAQPRVRELAGLARSELGEAGERALLAYAPDPSAAASGIGVVWPEEDALAVAQELLATLERSEDEPPDRTPLLASWRGADAVGPARVTPHLAIAPDPAALERGFVERYGPALLLGGVMLACGCGLLLALRAIRREALATQARADFLTLVTHELKTPLASIRLFAEMLVEGRVASDAKRDEYHRLLASESERLSALIENVLDLGRLERGERALDRRVQPLGDVVRDVVERFRPVAASAGMELELELGIEGGESCERLLADVDRGAIAQALLNLLDNARKYAVDGKRIVVTLATEPAEGGHWSARLTVRDFGPGVPAAEREAIFERFRRGDRQKDGSIAGLGLGLHLARTLVRAHGGELRCEEPTAVASDGCNGEASVPQASVPGSGAEFVMTLPFVECVVAEDREPADVLERTMERAPDPEAKT